MSRASYPWPQKAFDVLRALSEAKVPDLVEDLLSIVGFGCRSATICAYYTMYIYIYVYMNIRTYIAISVNTCTFICIVVSFRVYMYMEPYGIS